MSAPTSLKNLFAQVNSNGGTAATIFTHGTGLKNPDGTAGYGGVLDRIVVSNEDTAAHTVSIYRIPSGGTAGATNRIEKISMPSGMVYVLEGPYYSTDSAFYQVQLEGAISSVQVSCQAYYHEMS